MLTVGIARVGNEPVVRFTTDNKAVLDISLAFNYGRKGQDGKQPTQWVNASLWGNRAESVAPYIKKGNQLYVELKDLHVENYRTKEGTQGTSLKATIQEVKLLGSRESEQTEPHTQFEKPKSQPGTINELEDDIPF